MRAAQTVSVRAVSRRTGFLPWLVVSVAALLAPAALETYGLHLLTEMLTISILAIGLDLLIGYTGLLSLGHALFFGVGGYTAGLVAVKVTPVIYLTLPAAMIAAGAVAVVVGYLAIRTSGVYFLMTTLALAQMGYSLAMKLKVLGGSDGLAAIPRPSLGFADLDSSMALYYFVLVIFVLAFLLMRAIANSPFGQALLGIRENEPRMLALGYDTQRFKWASFVLSGILGGLAGAVHAHINGFFAPTEMYWTMSGQAIIMIIIGGLGTLIGPVLGAGVVVLLHNVVSSYTEFWPSVMGGVFVLFVFLARDGLVGIYKRMVRRGV